MQSSGSSIEKGESLLDTGYTLRAVGADCIVIRHPSAGAPHLMAQHLDIPVINAGDGMHEHPSQALLDAFTILKHKKSLKGLQATIIGDIFHSRVARSACHLLTKFGVKITLCGPPEFVPDVAATLAPGLRITRHIEDALRGTDVIMLLRVQKERLAGQKIRLQDYIARYQMTAGALKLAQARRDRHAPRADHSRPRADCRSRRRPAVRDRRRSSQRRSHAHGDSGAGVGEGEMSHGFSRIDTDSACRKTRAEC